MSSKEYGKEVYYWRKAHKICTCCGHKSAEPGSTLCPACKIKKSERSLKCYHKLSKKKKKEMFAKMTAQRRDRRTKGLCVRCGAPAGGKSLCEKHLEAARRYQNEYRQKKLETQEVNRND